MNAIVDTGFIVALVNSNDSNHEWALTVGPSLNTPLFTCEAVLSEAAFHLHSSGVVLEMVQSGFLELAFEASEHTAVLLSLSKRYADQQPDFADLCLIRMSELFPTHSIVTTDEYDFRIYRRNKRDVIPLICPPKRRR